MSSVGRTRSASRSSKRSDVPPPPPPPPQPVLTPQHDGRLEACAASASFFLYAQRNVILCLHHDTLNIERRFDRHQDDVMWIVIDNVSDHGAGRFVVSYDVGQIAIVWDLMTGDEVARFESYEDLRSAAWMKNGNVAFGNAVGNVILFEPSTKEHLSTRTIYDPITALAPGSDNHTFAIGYQNGTIFIAKLQPTFTILHTASSSRYQRDNPLSVVGLAWHGSSSKQKSDMLASQTADGDLLVWSVPKQQGADAPSIIRELGNFQGRGPSQCWFGWSKTGRIVQLQEGQTLAHDVRTKKVVSVAVPTIDGIIGMANFGPTATVFTLGRGHTVQQYDINPANTPMLVREAHHVLANLPPSPPNSIEEQRAAERNSKGSRGSGSAMPVFLEAVSSEDEGPQGMSPLAKISQEIDAIEDEMRDQVPPMASPVSSRSSVTSSTRSSGRRSGGSRHRNDRTTSRKAPSIYSSTSGAQSETTFFSSGSSIRSGSLASGRESVSLRSVSSAASSRHGTSRLRQELLRSPDEAKQTKLMDLFPYVKARLSEVEFRSPRYEGLSVDDLRLQMLSIVFGWDEDIEDLIHDEHSRHQPGTASSVLLSKWLGDSEADMAAAMIGSESMTSDDWMFLALSSMSNSQKSQKKVAETFVQRLLEKGDIHPAVAILLGLGEPSDAIEVYVSTHYFMEAVLLTCFIYPRDWQRISHLVRKWGERAVIEKQPNLAVRCFSCTSIEASEAYLSPRAQDAAYAAQQAHILGALSPPLSPPGSSGLPQRMKPEMAGLKLITNFNNQKQNPATAIGVTPIAESAITPGGANLRPRRIDPMSARTATPGGYTRTRMPSQSRLDRSAIAEHTPLATNTRSALPLTAVQASRDAFDRPSSRASRTSRAHSLSSAASVASAASRSGDLRPPEQELSVLSPVAYDPKAPKQAEALPSPAHGVFDALKSRNRSRNDSRGRKPDSLDLSLKDAVIVETGPETADTGYQTEVTEATTASRLTAERLGAPSPPLTGVSLASAKVRSIDNYISSLQEANYYAEQQRQVDRERASSRGARAPSRNRHREHSENRGRSNVRYIKSAKRSPSSPVSMSPDDPALQVTRDTFDDENFYRVTSPVDAAPAPRGRSRSHPRGTSKQRSASKTSRRPESPGSMRSGRSSSKVKPLKIPSRRTSPDRNLLSATRGRSQLREGSFQRSPSSPLPMSAQAQFYKDDEVDDKAHSAGSAGSGSDRERGEGRERIGERVRSRQRSTSRRHDGRSASNRRERSPDRHRPRERSVSRNPAREPLPDLSEEGSGSPLPRKASTRTASRSRMPKLQTNLSDSLLMTRKALAAKELEERRLSLARRTPAPVTHPDEIEKSRSPLMARSPLAMTDSIQTPLSAISDRRPEFPAMPPQDKVTGTSTSSVPIGLPATPRAMRHPKYMTADPNEAEDVPAIPEIPSNFAQRGEDLSKEAEDVPTLLPATTFGQKAPPRSASVPLERIAGQRRGSLGNNTSSHVRKSSASGPVVVASIDETISDSQVVIIEEPTSPAAPPPLLPELQHLAGPPPPPPPPNVYQRRTENNGGAPSGVINIAIDENGPLERHGTPATASTTTGTVPTLSSSSRATTPAIDSMRGPTPSASPQMHRRGRGSVGGDLGSKFRNVRDRMRSTSRSRVKSPPLESFTPSPYESVTMPTNFPPQFQRTASPPQPAHDYQSMMPPPPPPVPSLPVHEGEMGALVEVPSKSNTPAPYGGYRNPKEIRANMAAEQQVPQESLEQQPPSKSTTPYQGYRNPKEIRANMPPDMLQQGVYQPPASMM
ncbi:hypothetical protein NA57DRAFT_69465 [Rhizodiscina lignyota]|uniref:Gem-associated protein 5 TPR domain-containing protein n=1 Tax=Rhizodiscina lignyota TaxID=1504668 RepID=A0A9P4M004_9PEZI|nr:hypothetical protein NA57DRAFT_69465 [Rhizodiscina lignyota]